MDVASAAVPVPLTLDEEPESVCQAAKRRGVSQERPNGLAPICTFLSPASPVLRSTPATATAAGASNSLFGLWNSEGGPVRRLKVAAHGTQPKSALVTPAARLFVSGGKSGNLGLDVHEDSTPSTPNSVRSTPRSSRFSRNPFSATKPKLSCIKRALESEEVQERAAEPITDHDPISVRSPVDQPGLILPNLETTAITAPTTPRCSVLPPPNPFKSPAAPNNSSSSNSETLVVSPAAIAASFLKVPCHIVTPPLSSDEPAAAPQPAANTDAIFDFLSGLAPVRVPRPSICLVRAAC